MKKAFGLIGAALLFAGPALAADLPVRAPVYKPPVYKPPVMVPTWHGWCVGGNAGWVGSADDTVTNTRTDICACGYSTALTLGVVSGSVPLNGFLGGGQVGYNWQSDNWVYGLEADFDGSSAKSSTAAVSGPSTTTLSRQLDWLTTARGRVGFSVTPTFLTYGTGGLAAGHTDLGSAITNPLGVPSPESESTTNLTSTSTAVGWTAGAGAEWLFAPQWSVKAEYLYVDLGKHSNTLTYTYFGGNTSTLTSTVNDTAHIVRAGINYHF